MEERDLSVIWFRGRHFYEVRQTLNLESFVRVMEPYLVECLQSFCVLESPLSCVQENVLFRGVTNSFLCRRVFGRVTNKDVELCLVFSCRNLISCRGSHFISGQSKSLYITLRILRIKQRRLLSGWWVQSGISNCLIHWNRSSGRRLPALWNIKTCFFLFQVSCLFML